MQQQYEEWKCQALKEMAAGNDLSDIFIAKMLQNTQGKNEMDYTDDNVQYTLREMFEAGVGTTLSTLTSLIRPDVQSKLHGETVRVLHGDALSLPDKPSMQYHVATFMKYLGMFS